MTAAAAVFCCTIVLALVEGYGGPAFARYVAADAFAAAMPLVAVFLVARFAAGRLPAHAVRITRLLAAAEGVLVVMAFGWWWVEPHVALTTLTDGSLEAMGWQALAGALIGFAVALGSARASDPLLFREVALGALAVWLLGGGRVYRAYDHVEAATRIATASAIAVSVLALAVGLYLLLRSRRRVASAIPALGPAAAMLTLFAFPSPAVVSPRESVLLIVVDTLRADIADEGFDGRVEMPELARLAESGVRFTQAISPAPWTLPATVSLLSGWNPHRHQSGVSASPLEVFGGDPRAMYLASALRDAGYLTAAFVNNPWLRPWFGIDEGFLTWRPYHGRALDGVALALDWLDSHRGAPTFTLLHLMDPHWPYDAPPVSDRPRTECTVCDSLFWTQFGQTTPEQRSEVRSRYAAEVAYTDAMLGWLRESLAASGGLANTWVIVTSDHGEELWEHGGFLHGHSLYDELLRVPLVVVPPVSQATVRRGARVGDQVRLEDVAATILEIAGIDVSRATDGKSLTPLLGAAADPSPRTAVAGYIKSPTDLRFAVRRPPWKAIFSDANGAGGALFDIREDAREARDLGVRTGFSPTADQQEAWKALFGEPDRRSLDVARTQAQPGGVAPDADSEKQLRSLGYAN